MKREFLDLLKLILSAFDNKASLPTSEYKLFQRLFPLFLKLSAQQEKILGKERISEELATEFLEYLIADHHKQAMIMNCTYEFSQGLYVCRNQFINYIFTNLPNKSLEYRIFEKLKNRDLGKDRFFSNQMTITKSEMALFLSQNITFLTPNTSPRKNDMRTQIALRLYGNDSAYDHPLLTNDSLCQLYDLILKHFGIAPTMLDFAGAIADQLPQDIYSTETTISPSEKDDEPEEADPTELIADTTSILSDKIIGMEAAKLFWQELRIGDKFVLVAKFNELKDKEMRAWAESHGCHAGRFSDRRKTLEFSLRNTIIELTQNEQSSFLSALRQCIRDFENKYPLPE
ncbi:MAG: hypothetical protein GX117_11800 [Candidatus Hydrogenedentes bacterium]|nr:hypothetical protein [Candidatus Hydrogenedentota bacterium]